MKNKFNLFSLLVVGSVYSQVGINTSNPEATMDIRGKNHLGTVTSQDGLLVPRVGNLSVAGSVNGQLVYLVQNSGSFVKGFHYWSSTDWTPLIRSESGDARIDAWVDNPQKNRIELGTKSDGTERTTGTEFVAQDNGSVGIGSSRPNESAILDLTSNKKGLKLPYINLQSLTDKTTISNPVDGLMVYNIAASTDLQNGIYVFDSSAQIWNLLQKVSEKTGSNISKIVYPGNPNDNKIMTIGKYRFRVTSNNVIQISHSQPTENSEILSLVTNVFKRGNVFYYSNPKNIPIAYGNTTWAGNPSGTPGAIADSLTSGATITLYFGDVSDSKFYKVVYFRSGNSPSIVSITGEIF